MRRAIAFVIALCLAAAGCEGEYIADCGRACKIGDRPMLRYNKADGCVCGPAADGGAP